MTWLDRVTDATTGNEAATRREQLVAIFEGFYLTIAGVIAGILAALGLFYRLQFNRYPANRRYSTLPGTGYPGGLSQCRTRLPRFPPTPTILYPLRDPIPPRYRLDHRNPTVDRQQRLHP